MKNVIKIFSLMIILSNLLFGQKLTKQIHSLEEDFRQFKYDQVLEKGRFLLADPYAAKKDSLQIFQFMLSAAYALDDTAQAKNIIKEILRTEPSFTLDTRTTSPKIIEFFNYIKKQIARKKPSVQPPVEHPKVQRQLQVPLLKAEYLAAFALFPGSGHLWAGDKKSGYMRSTASAVFLAGIVYSAIETKRRHDDYLSAASSADFDKLYKRYDTAYKYRNVLLIGYGLWSLYNLYDLQQRYNWQVTIGNDTRTLSLNMSIHW